MGLEGFLISMARIGCQAATIRYVVGRTDLRWDGQQFNVDKSLFTLSICNDFLGYCCGERWSNPLSAEYI